MNYKTLLAVASIPLLLAGCLDYSDGERAGIVQKLSRKGFLCKTWEGEMILGGLKKQTNLSSDGKSTTTSMVPNTFQFTVEDGALLPKIQQALATGSPVEVSYRQELITFCRSDSGYFITAVK